MSNSKSVNFTVRTNPNLTYSQNATFNDSNFALTFTVDHPVSELSYSLDGQELVQITGNTTLTGLPNGQHNVTVYATDSFGITDISDPLFFNIEAPPVVPLTVALVLAILAIVGSVVYSRAREKYVNKQKGLSSKPDGSG
ncbi:MAG: hypothetical protein NWE92_02300 [Candidatus Bathyarchaeota archaeon]|nr:hypothetical protein [Candidatus Bathyarchaeota archaeon]